MRGAVAAGSAGTRAANSVRLRQLAAPTSRRIIDVHVHIFFQNEKPARAEFTPRAGNSARPDGDVQINASWDQFRYDMGAVDRR